MLCGRDEYELGFLELLTYPARALGPRWFALSQLLSPRSLLSFSERDNNKQAFLAWVQPGSWLWSCSFCFEIYTAVLNLKQYLTTSADDSWTIHSTLDCLFMPDSVRCVLFSLPAGGYSQAAARTRVPLYCLLLSTPSQASACPELTLALVLWY